VSGCSRARPRPSRCLAPRSAVALNSAAGRITTKEIPRLTEPGQLAQIIDRRGEFADPPVRCGELLTEAGLHRLTAIHMSERVGGLRATLGVFHQALGLAISDASESIDERHVTAADTLAGG
jgi:hypothetical protein